MPANLLLFDWGDTLMRDLPQFSGPMAGWPRVEALPGAAETLQALAGEWRIALATNAADSDEAQIRQALQRGGLDAWIEQVYCFKRLGVKKPAPEFFAAILADAAQLGGAPPGRVVMVGDSFAGDVQGALSSGLQAVWLNTRSAEQRAGPGYTTIHLLAELPAALQSLMVVG